MVEYYTGLKLYGLAKRKAKHLGLANTTAKMDELICSIQQQEGNIDCFRKRPECNEIMCCWQAACTARMMQH